MPLRLPPPRPAPSPSLFSTQVSGLPESSLQDLGIFHFSPLFPRTQQLDFQPPFILTVRRLILTPPGSRRHTPTPPQGHRSHRLLAQNPRVMPCSPVPLLLKSSGPHPRLPSSSATAWRAHPCWPPPRPPRRALCSPGRIHPPNPPVLAGRTWTKCDLEAWPTREGGSRGHRWGLQRCLGNAKGRARGQVGSWCPTGSLQRPRLPIARPHPRPGALGLR